MDKDQMRQLAQRLAKEHVEAEPSTQKVLWFPDTEEVRLVEVVPDAIPSDEVVAFHFGPDRPSGIPVPMAIALILPGETRRIRLPEGWGDWDDAEEIEVVRAREAG